MLDARKSHQIASLCDFACILATTLPEGLMVREIKLIMIMLMTISIIIHLSPKTARK